MSEFIKARDVVPGQVVKFVMEAEVGAVETDDGLFKFVTLFLRDEDEGSGFVEITVDATRSIEVTESPVKIEIVLSKEDQDFLSQDNNSLLPQHRERLLIKRIKEQLKAEKESTVRTW